jgi:uncharacterized protein YndB with AHSA1/START domain
MTRDIVHGIEIHAEPKAVFDTIATRSGLAAFWTPDVQGDDSEGGELSFGFSGSPARLPIRVTRLDPPRTIEWGCPGGFPFWEGTRVKWSIDPERTWRQGDLPPPRVHGRATRVRARQHQPHLGSDRRETQGGRREWRKA